MLRQACCAAADASHSDNKKTYLCSGNDASCLSPDADAANLRRREGGFAYWPQLVAGLSFGAAYAAGAYLINAGDPATGHMTALVSSAALTAGMGLRLAKTGKFMPAGVLTAAALLASIYNF
eukprot:gene13651-biopygen15591